MNSKFEISNLQPKKPWIIRFLISLGIRSENSANWVILVLAVILIIISLIMILVSFIPSFKDRNVGKVITGNVMPPYFDANQ